MSPLAAFGREGFTRWFFETDLSYCFLHHLLESVHIRNRQFAEHFAVDLNPIADHSVNEIAVSHIAFFAGSADSRNPESAEISLLRPPVPERVLTRLHHLLVSS